MENLVEEMRPKVSVIIPVYNAMPYLTRSLDDVLQQTMREIEVICVDDGSTDNSHAVLCAYAERDQRVRILTQQNKFAGAARNKGIEEARGDYLMFLDADDLFEPQLIERLYSACKKDAAQIALCRSDMFDMARGKFLKNNALPRSLFPKHTPFSPTDYADYLFQFITPVPWAKIFRRDLIQEGGIRFENRRNTNDLYFSFCNAAIAQKITFVDEVLVHLRRGHTTNIQSSSFKNPYECAGAFLEVKRELQTRGLYRTFQQSFVNVAITQSHYVLNMVYENQPAYLEFCTALKEMLFHQLDVLDHPPEFYHSCIEYCTLQWLCNSAAQVSAHSKFSKLFFFASCSLRTFGVAKSLGTVFRYMQKKWFK